MWQAERSNEPEILDLGPAHYSAEEYEQCLSLLGRINRTLGGFRATLKAFKILPPPLSILEVGCGGGELCRQLHAAYPKASVLGIDLSGGAIAYARNHTSQSGKLTFAIQEDKSLPFADNSFDVVTTMLVCHHMSDDELVEFLRESHRVCSHAVVINDLQRHLLAYLGYSVVAPLLFPNRLIWHDGRLSIRRAFRKEDWKRLLDKAGFSSADYELRWHWAFRWTLTVRKK